MRRVTALATVSGIALLLVLTGCAATPCPSTESPHLTPTDIEVLRVIIASVIEPLIFPHTSKRFARLATTTLTFGRPQELRATLPSPPPQFDWPWKSLLTADERAAWSARNGSPFEIPALGLSGLVSHRKGDRDQDGPIVSVSAPVYSTNDTAVIYATFDCGGLCGEGRLIRLRREGGQWRITESHMLWIS
jgi:hypothetical protein